MTIENNKDLNAKIKHYLKAGDFETAKKFAYQYKKIPGFDIDDALEEIRKAETGTKKK